MFDDNCSSVNEWLLELQRQHVNYPERNRNIKSEEYEAGEDGED